MMSERPGINPEEGPPGGGNPEAKDDLKTLRLVAMPMVLSVTMAAGARLLAKTKAIVSKLVAIEELAGD